MDNPYQFNHEKNVYNRPVGLITFFFFFSENSIAPLPKKQYDVQSAFMDIIFKKKKKKKGASTTSRSGREKNTKEEEEEEVEVEVPQELGRHFQVLGDN